MSRKSTTKREHEPSKRAFLGRGWGFPVDTDSTGAVEVVEAEVDIEEAIRIILGTAKGERVMRPEFGCGIHDYVFSTVNTTTLHMVETSVEEALVEWEPRIDVRSVEVSPGRLDAGELLISIDYRVRQSNVEHNLVYPFYLSE